VGIGLMGPSLPNLAEAQIISPGKLSQVHEELGGMGNCTQCHQLRRPGADGGRCLQCHQALSQRIAREDGYHGRLQEKDCGTCHKEHLGEDFALVRMDPDTFSHSSTGYTLRGAHEPVECRSCHLPALVADPELRKELSGGDGLERTYLGLNQQCASCHEPDNPHKEQFSDRDCSVCHAEVEWESPTEFDHDQASYPLEGQHRDLACEGCHVVEQPGGPSASIRYVPVAATDCKSCHEDPHKTRTLGQCNGCHETTGWSRVDRSAVEATFDHGTTHFALVGAHDEADCQACHSATRGTVGEIQLRFSGSVAGRSYPTPEFESCNSCHLDSHDGTFEDRGCDVCHATDSWTSPAYDRAKHQMELRFELTGSHSVTPCSACHENGVGDDRQLVFRFEDPASCSVCHEADDPHKGAFQPPGCDLCHGTDLFEVVGFEHGLLDKSGWVGSCISCHETDDPHGKQFQGRDCGDCHETDAFTISDFDHGTTRFVLEGAHAEVSCGECHSAREGGDSRSGILYSPVDTACTACHGGGG